MFTSLKSIFSTMKFLGVDNNSIDIVEKIHAEFDSAQDRLLAEANRIIAEAGVVTVEKDKKVDDLIELGFTNAKSVSKFYEKQQEQEEKKLAIVGSRAQADLIQYYKSAYPFLKFLTVSELDRICKKYSLIYAPVHAYAGDVPVKNITDIKNAQELCPEDSVKSALHVEYTGSDASVIRTLQAILDTIECSDGVITREKVHQLLKGDGCDVELLFYPITNTSVIWKITSILEKIGKRMGLDHVPSLSRMRIRELRRDQLMIAAPKSEFSALELSRMTNTSEVAWSDSKILVPDPIVFRYVRGGIQVLTKWGPEASDPALLNEIDN